MTNSENFERFQYFNFETDFLENGNFFQKTRVPLFSWKHRFHTKMLYKNAISKTNVKTNWTVSTKWTYHKERGFASNFRFTLRSYKKLIWCTNNPNAHHLTYCKWWSFIWRCFFPLSILNCLCECISKRSITSSQGSIFSNSCIELFLKFFLLIVVKTDKIKGSSDYCPISVLLCFSKMVECIMYNLFNNYFEKQFGF